MRKLSQTETRLLEIQEQLRSWTDFVETLQVPGDFAIAVATGRVELIKLAVPRAVTQEECAVLYKFIGGLIETNAALREHTQLVAEMAREAAGGLVGSLGTVSRLRSYANYQTPKERVDFDA